MMLHCDAISAAFLLALIYFGSRSGSRGNSTRNSSLLKELYIPKALAFEMGPFKYVVCIQEASGSLLTVL